jgi:hypothetical protein
MKFLLHHSLVHLFDIRYSPALVVKLVDTQDLKSCFPQRKYRFNSDPGHESKINPL